MVFEWMLSDLSCVIKDHDNPISESVIKAYMYMLLKGVQYLHSLHIMHRVKAKGDIIVSWNFIITVVNKIYHNLLIYFSKSFHQVFLNICLVHQSSCSHTQFWKIQKIFFF